MLLIIKFDQEHYVYLIIVRILNFIYNSNGQWIDKKKNMDIGAMLILFPSSKLHTFGSLKDLVIFSSLFLCHILIILYVTCKFLIYKMTTTLNEQNGNTFISLFIQIAYIHIYIGLPHFPWTNSAQPEKTTPNGMI